MPVKVKVVSRTMRIIPMIKNPKTVKPGDVVGFMVREPTRMQYALVTKVYSPHQPPYVKPPELNLVIVAAGKAGEDEYGKQVVRKIRILHKSMAKEADASVNDNYWMASDDMGETESPSDDIQIG